MGGSYWVQHFGVRHPQTFWCQTPTNSVRHQQVQTPTSMVCRIIFQYQTPYAWGVRHHTPLSFPAP